jgi:hypothetical protein
VTGPARVLGALFVDLGEGREIHHGDRAGQISYRRQPRARFECLRCHTTEGPVTGPHAVAAFVARIQTDHRATCPATTTQGAQAA